MLKRNAHRSERNDRAVPGATGALGASKATPSTAVGMVAELEEAAGLTSGNGRDLVKALRSEGLIEPAGRDAWRITQAGQTLSSATAAKRVTRATAEKALQQFLGRVERANNDPYFLGEGNEGGSLWQHAEARGRAIE